MTAPPAPYERPRSSGGRTFLLVVAAACGIGVAATLTCVGGFAALAAFGGGLLEEQVRAEVEGALEPHVGAIEGFDLDWTASGLHEEPNVMVYEVEGSEGAGRLVADHVTVDGDREEVRWAVLRKAGERAPVVLVGEPPAKFLEAR